MDGMVTGDSNLDRSQPGWPERPTLEAYVEALASGAATPGGGSAAALAGALGAALGSMTAWLTAGRPQFAAVDATMRSLAERLDPLRDSLMADVRRDAAAYDGVMAAIALPQGSEDERSRRQAKVQAAIVLAGEVPLGVARTAVDVLRLLEEVARDGNPNAVTDAGAGAQLVVAAVNMAALNVLINATSLCDQERAAGWRRDVAALQAEASGLLERIMAVVMQRGGLAIR